MTKVERTFEKDMQIPLQYLAAATLIHWMEIPKDIREKIKETAVTGSIGGLPQTTSLHEQIKILTAYSEPKG